MKLVRFGEPGREKPGLLGAGGVLRSLEHAVADIGGDVLNAASLEVDGHRYQNGNTHTMVFGVASLVSYISRFMTLMPGDIISTGTPPGVGLGQKPPVYLEPGSVMELEIEGLGRQRQVTVAARGSS